ncbi:MAG: HEAT repeat domain-containing protein [Aridibacter famidurans]|nr:HEAT repeat domain-containing protein [Aridibacter famidurans]
MDRRFSSSAVASAGIAAALFLFAFPVFGQVPSEIDSLASSVRSGTVEEKRDALYRLRVIGTEEASRAAVPALSDPEPIVRATAAGALTALPSSEAVAALLPLLNDKKDFVRKEAVIALGGTGDPAAEQPLIRSLERDDEEAVRAAAAEAIGSVGTAASLLTLTRVLAQKPKDKRQALRRFAARAAGLIAGRLQKSDPANTTPESFLPSKFKRTLSERRDLTVSVPDFESISSVLRQVLINEDERSDTKREAAFALGEIGDRYVISALQTCSISEDPYLAEACKESISRLPTLENGTLSELLDQIRSTRFNLLSGDQFRIADDSDRPIFILLFATWDVPAFLVLDELDALQEEYGEKGLEVVALTVDPEDPHLLSDFRRKRNLRLRMGWADEESVNRFFGITSLMMGSRRNGIPQGFLFGKEGALVRHFFGGGNSVLDEISKSVRQQF